MNKATIEYLPETEEARIIFFSITDKGVHSIITLFDLPIRKLAKAGCILLEMFEVSVVMYNMCVDFGKATTDETKIQKIMETILHKASQEEAYYPSPYWKIITVTYGDEKELKRKRERSANRGNQPADQPGRNGPGEAER